MFSNAYWWIRLLACAGVAVLIFVPNARGHTILLSRGQAILRADRIEVQLEVGAEDFLHYSNIAGDGEGMLPIAPLMEVVRQHGSAMGAMLVVRDAAGRRLTPMPATVRTDWPAVHAVTTRQLRSLRAYYVLTYPVSTPQTLLTFQFKGEEPPARIPSQIVLLVRGAGQTEGSTLRLTSRGNAETVELRWDSNGTAVVGPAPLNSGGACAADEERGPARFKDVFAEFDLGEQGVSARVLIPLPLLQTWIELQQRCEDYLEPDEQRTAVPALRDLLRHAIRAEVDGKPVSPESVDLMILHADGRRTDPSNAAVPAGMWTARLEACLDFSTVDDADRVILRWRLFNNAVLRASAAIRVDGLCTEYDLTTYQPVYEWKRAP